MNDFKDKVVYQIYPKSFMDSNGDGFGDLKGVTAKLDYLADLGVDYLWLTPFFPSPQRDNGYDVADYRAVDPRYGTMENLEELIREADRRGIGLMLDMVFNHTSTEHEWFKKALAGDKKYQDYYIFKDGTPDCYPTNWVSKFGGPAWEYVPCLGKWYLHLYDVMQADLNWENPAVREEMADILRFWKAKGIKGFRFDVINVISKPKFYEDDYEGDGRRFYTDGRNVHKYLKELVAAGGIDGMITVGEMSSTTLENCIGYTAEGNHELTMCFNFHHLKVDYKDGQKWELREPDYLAMKKLFQTWQEGMQAHGGWNALFWCNHDQPRAVSRFGSDTTYWKESAKMLAVATHFMRGTPYIYQGEELGMTNPHFTKIEQYRDRGRDAEHYRPAQPRRQPHPDAVGRERERRVYHRYAVDRHCRQLQGHQRRCPNGRPGFHPQLLQNAGGPAQENAGHQCGKNRVLVPRQRGFVSLSPVRRRDGAAGSLQPAGAGNCQAPARRLDRCRETAG